MSRPRERPNPRAMTMCGIIMIVMSATSDMRAMPRATHLAKVNNLLPRSPLAIVIASYLALRFGKTAHDDTVVCALS